MKLFLSAFYPCPREIEQNSQLLSRAIEYGYTIAKNPSEADIIVFLGCASRSDTISKSMMSLRQVLRDAKKGSNLIITGCFGEYFRKELSQMNEIKTIDNIKDVLKHLWSLKHPDAPFIEPIYTVNNRELVPAITIGNGCDFGCTFCKCNYLDRPLISAPLEEIYAKLEAERAAGKNTMTLTALNSTRYGKDLYGENTLYKIIQKIIDLGFQTLDIKAMNIADIDRKLEKVLLSSPIPIHLDLPLQHSDDRVLKAMNRKITRKEMQIIVERLMRNPKLYIFSAILVGFPYETPESLMETFEWHRDMGIYDLDIFPYSDPPRIPSHKLPQIDPDDYQERLMVSMMMKNIMRVEGMEKLIGQYIPVLSSSSSDFVSTLNFKALAQFDPPINPYPNNNFYAKVLNVKDPSTFILDGKPKNLRLIKTKNKLK